MVQILYMHHLMKKRYTLIYEDGTIEPLSNDQFEVTGGGKGATLSGLSASKNNIVIHVTKQKVKVVAKDKDLKRCESIVVSGSKFTHSGVSTSIGDGLDIVLHMVKEFKIEKYL